jgi:hypothetical protein
MLPLRAYGWWALLGASLVTGLAGLVRLADPTGEPDHLTGTIRLPHLVTWSIIGLFGLAALVLAIDVVRRMRSRRHEEEESLNFSRMAPPRPPWLQAFAQIMSLVNFIVIGYLLWRNVLPFADFMSLGAVGGAGGALAHERTPDAPFFVTWTFALLALLAGAGALAFAVWITSSDRLAKWWELEEEEAPVPPPLVEALDESLDDLRAEPDARRAIIRCYARFERAAADAGLKRARAQTPMEFMGDVLSRLPAPRDAVRALTGLFELARFSDRALGDAERGRALGALDDIKTAVDLAMDDVAR